MSIGFLPGAICSAAARGFIVGIAVIGFAAVTTYCAVTHGLAAGALFAGPIIAAMVLKASIVWLCQRRSDAGWARHDVHRKILNGILQEHPSYDAIPAYDGRDCDARFRVRDENRARIRKEHPEWAERLAKAEALSSESYAQADRRLGFLVRVDGLPVLFPVMVITLIIIAIAF
jgi:hypothetical protein